MTRCQIRQSYVFRIALTHRLGLNSALDGIPVRRWARSRHAAAAWNAVELVRPEGGVRRAVYVEYAAEYSGGDIVFDELDPLTLGLTATNAAQNAFVSGPNGTFVPIRGLESA